MTRMRSGRRVWGARTMLALAVGPLAFPVAANADGDSGATAVVALDGCAEGTTAPHANQLRESLGQLEGVQVISRDDTIAHLGGAPRGSLADAERLLASARFDFLDQSSHDRAERTLLTAIEDLRTLPPSDARWQDLRDGQTLLAYMYSRKGDRAKAEATISRVLAVDPEFEPSIDLYPPSFRSWVGGVRKKVVKGSTSSLRVQTHPAGRPVVVEGRVVGTAPVTVKLPAGSWRVEADFGTGGSIPRTVQLKDAANIELWDNFEGAVHAGRGPCITTDGTREGRLSSLVRLSAIFGADQMVAIREEEPNPYERYIVAALVDARTGQELREGKVKLVDGLASRASYARLAEFVFTGSAKPPVLVGPIVAGLQPTASSGSSESVPANALPSTQVAKSEARPMNGLRVGGYVAGAGAVAGLGVGGYFLLQANGDQQALNELKLSDTSSYQEKDKARVGQLQRSIVENQNNGRIAGGIGLAAAATSVVLFILSGDDAPAPDATSIQPTANGVQVRF